MLRSINEIFGYSILAKDDTIGMAHDFYFDDLAWLIRYLVVDTGTWLPGRKVLVSPLVVGQPEWEGQLLPVALDKEQIENSPNIDTKRPISRQQEAELHAHYHWPPYWEDVSFFEAKAAGFHPSAYLDAMRMAGARQPEPKAPLAPEAVAEQTKTDDRSQDPHLRSIKEVTEYDIQAIDGEIGHLADFIVGDEDWTIRYMVIDTRDWLPGKKVLLAPAWIERISWPDENIFVDLQRETIKNSPEYDPSAPVNRAYETRLYDFYGRPAYWK